MPCLQKATQLIIYPVFVLASLSEIPLVSWCTYSEKNLKAAACENSQTTKV